MLKKITLLLVAFLFLAAGMYAANQRFTLVIDAGHGGHDAGALGAKSKEKNINLNVALAFGRYVERNMPDVRVIYTRTTDVFIPLHDRANIANKANADLFISVHTNALPAGKIARGFERNFCASLPYSKSQRASFAAVTFLPKLQIQRGGNEDAKSGEI